MQGLTVGLGSSRPRPARTTDRQPASGPPPLTQCLQYSLLLTLDSRVSLGPWGHMPRVGLDGQGQLSSGVGSPSVYVLLLLVSKENRFS